MAMDIAARLFEAKEDTFEDQDDKCGNAGPDPADHCACTVSASIPLHPTQSNSNQDGDSGTTGFLLI